MSGPFDISQVVRFSFCCSGDECRRRTTPPSVRFLARKQYLGVLVYCVGSGTGGLGGHVTDTGNHYLDMKLDEAQRDAAGSALQALVDETDPSFSDWCDAFRDEPDGFRYFYGQHSAYVLPFDRDQEPQILSDPTVPAHCQRLGVEVLTQSVSILGCFDDSALCLRLDETTDARRGRLLVVDRLGIDALLSKLFPDERLTPAESRTLLQVVCGISLREAAIADGVSHETKRTQIKAVSAKSRKRGQRELTSLVLTQLLFGLNQSTSATPGRQRSVLQEYRRRYLPRSIRLHVVEASSGDKVRLLEFGDRQGQALIVLHPQALPFWTEDDVNLVEELGLRLVWPLRRGALEGGVEAVDFSTHAELARVGIDTARELFVGECATVVCLMSACWYGIDYAHRHSERVKSLILIGACYRPTQGNRAPGRLRSGILRLSSQHRSFAGLLLRFVGQRIRDPERLKHFLNTLYAESDADLAVLANEFADEESSLSLSIRFSDSEQSIVHDFLHLGFPNFDLLHQLSCPVEFIHGEQDPVHSVDDITELASQLRAPLQIITDAGQLLYRQNWASAINAIVVSANRKAARVL